MGSEWASATIGDAFDLVNGFAFKSKDFLEEGVPVIKIKNVKAGYFSEHEFSYVDPSFLDSREEKIARFDDLLISMSGNRHDGSPETWVGKVALFRKTTPYFINQRVGALRVKDPENFDPRFMSYLLASWMYQSMFIAVATSSGGQANLSPGQILSAPIDFPNLDTQKSIAHILGTLDDKIELNRQMNATLESMAQALFKSWFVDFDPVIANALAAGNPIPPELQARAEKRALQARAEKRAALGDKRKPLPAEIQQLFPDRFTYTDEMGWVPEGWELGVIGDLCSLAIGGQWGEDEQQEGLVPAICLRGTDMESLRNFGFAPNGPVRYIKSNAVEKRLPSSSDLLVAGSGAGPCGRPLWFSPKIQALFEYPVIYSNFVKRFTTHGPEYAKYIDRILINKFEDRSIEDFITGTSVPNLDSNGLLSGCHIFIPDRSILSSFSDHLDAIYAKLYFEQTLTLSKLRDTLLPKLLSGQLRIPEAEQQVAEAL